MMQGKIKSLHSPDLCHHWIMLNPHGFTQPYASQADIDYSLCLITQGRHRFGYNDEDCRPMAKSCSWKLLTKRFPAQRFWDVAKAMTWFTSCFSGSIWRCYSQVSLMVRLRVKWYSHWLLPIIVVVFLTVHVWVCWIFQSEHRAYWKIKMLFPDLVWLNFSPLLNRGQGHRKNRERAKGNSCHTSMSILVPQECTSQIDMTSTVQQLRINPGCPSFVVAGGYCFVLVC